jgi:hypothetical protein
MRTRSGSRERVRALHRASHSAPRVGACAELMRGPSGVRRQCIYTLNVIVGKLGTIHESRVTCQSTVRALRGVDRCG